MLNALNLNRVILLGAVVAAAVVSGFLILNLSGTSLLIAVGFFSVPFALKTVVFSLSELGAIIKEIKLIHVFWFMLLVSLLMFKGRTAEEALLNQMGAQQWLRVLPALLAGSCGVGLLLRNGTFFHMTQGPLLFFSLYCLSSLISVLYTVQLGYSAWKATELVIILLVVSSFLSSPGASGKIATLNAMNFTWNNILLITVIIGAIFFRDAAFQEVLGGKLPQLHGVLPIINANSVGLMSALAILFVFSRFIDKTSRKTPLLVSLCVFLLVFIFAQSRTSIIGLTFSIAVFILLQKKIKKQTKILLLMLSIAIFISDFFGEILSLYVLRGKSVESISVTTLSGRTEGWEIAIEKFFDSPFWGYGIASGARYTVLSEVAGREEQTGLHNAFLDVLVNNGIIGFIPWIIAYIWTLKILLKRALKCPDDRQAGLFVSVMILFGVRMTTGDALVYHDYSMLMFLGILSYAQLIYMKRS